MQVTDVILKLRPCKGSTEAAEEIIRIFREKYPELHRGSELVHNHQDIKVIDMQALFEAHPFQGTDW
jgi:hypothetical protein